MSTMQPPQYLAKAYQRSVAKTEPSIDAETRANLDTIAEHRDRCKAVLAVTVTLMLKKIMSPNQDIRRHQAGMQGGFSARSLDANAVTPFLRQQGFPYMASGAGALTRSLEQAVPYDMNYTGHIRPPLVRAAFLSLVDSIQTRNIDPQEALAYLFIKLINYRDIDKSMKLIKPINLPIKDMVANISQHFQNCKGEGSELPVLAVYAVYQRLIVELQRYKNCTLCDLQSHNTADIRSGFLGDIQVNDQHNVPFEIVEVKHNIKLSPQLVHDCYDKFKSSAVNTYYLLSTNETLKNPEQISEIILSIEKNHGCQMIVNGIQTSLRYYLRLLANPHDFLHLYVKLLENKSSYNVKMQWQNLWE